MVMVRRVAVLGATRGMGRALARALADRGDRVCLLGRDVDELEKSAADLTARGADAAVFVRCDLDRPDSFESALDETVRLLRGLDVVIVTAASFATQAHLESDRD